MRPDAERMHAAVRACALTALLALVAGCAGAPRSGPASAQEPLLIAGLDPQAILPAPEIERINTRIPAAYRDAVLRAEAFGRTIHSYSRFAKEAGNLVAPGGHSSFPYPPVGWLTERTATGLGVNFIVASQNILGVAVEVTRSKRGDLRAKPFSPPRRLTPQETTLWKSRQLAYTSHFKPCAKRYNPAVIPARIAGVALIYVYLLPSSADTDTIYLGGYHRIAISPDGGVILEDHAFTRGCVTLQRKPKSVAAQVTELVSGSPTSVQVYASLRYGLPVYVETASNGLRWKVENGLITLVKK